MYVLYYASMLQCWHLVWILVRTDHPCLGVGCHNEEPSCSDLSIFATWGKIVGSSTSYNSTQEERKAALLYMYANIDEWTNILSKCLFYIYVNKHASVLLVHTIFTYFPTASSTSNVGHLGVNL
jgi:hypothetical protein